MLKKIFKFFGFLFLLLILLGIGAYFFLNESLPKGSNPAKADQLAQKMLKAVNSDAWKNTNVVQWSFKGGHDFVWDKKRDCVQVRWDNNNVLINIHDRSKSVVYVDGVEQKDDGKNKIVETAWSYFCNDSFWLIAPMKAMDKGVTRSIVEQEDGSEALMVSYGSGGVTPGDSYLWFLDEQGLPKSYKMWVSIIPIGGIEATWENWQKMPTGVMLPTEHKISSFNLTMSNVKAGNSLADIGINEDIFKVLF